jgi:hypothetical protein
MKPGSKPPYELGDQATLDVQAEKGELLWGNDDVSIPWRELPLHGTFALQGLRLPRTVSLEIGGKGPRFKLATELKGDLGRSPLKLQWSTLGKWELAPMVEGLKKAAAGSTGVLAPLAVLAQIQLRGGTLDSSGEATFLPSNPSGANFQGKIGIHGLGLDWRAKALAVRGASIDLEGAHPGAVKASLEADGVDLHHAHARLKKTPISIVPEGPQKFSVSIGSDADLPLQLDGIPLRLGSFRGKIDLAPPRPQSDDEDDPEYFHLATNLRIPPVAVSTLAAKFCVDTRKLPPATFSADFSKIEISNTSLEPTGQARVDLFHGAITLSDLGFYDFLTAVPESDFSLNWDGIRLDELGNWVGFGEMDGFLTGFARDVTMQANVFTHFDLKTEAKPNRDHTWNVVFSPEAMENFIKVVAGDALDQMPGIVHWFMFGWPSHFRGYDIDYAGISMYSQDGSILLETLDPPEVAKQGNHFILYGTRFRMPLRSNHYPVVVDAMSMRDLLLAMADTLAKMAENKRLEREAAQKTAQPTETQNHASDCQPDLLR